jgi:quercetin dioxygenase-like cupin family protein
MRYRLRATLLSMAPGLVVGSTIVTQGAQPAPLEIRPEALSWGPNPAIPPGGLNAVVVGNPSQPGRYVLRVRFPADYRIMPHTHPEERIYTVLSGTWYIGLGDEFDGGKLKRFPPGSVFVLPPNTPHFHWARSDISVVQVNAVGPTAINYVNPADDPRKGSGGE